MGGKIDMYFDCVSPYSFFAISHILKNREALEAYNVAFELHPVFQGGVMQKSGNKPPFSVPAKASYSKYDSDRAQKYFGVEIVQRDFFPIMSLLPQRCMTFIKDKYSAEKLEAAAMANWKILWQDGIDISKPENMLQCLERTFTPDEAAEIMQASSTPEVKSKLLATTDEVLANGAFGSPWFMVTNSKGIREPFFGSDRFHYMWEFLELPWTDVRLLPKSKM